MSDLTEAHLAAAIIAGDFAFVDSYLKSGAAVENITLVGPDGCGRAPLESAAIAEAIYGGSPAVTKAILDRSSLEQQGSVLQTFASENVFCDRMAALLRAGIQLDLLYKNQTALQVAVGNGNRKMAYLLLAHGADPELVGEYGSAIKIAGYNDVLRGMLESAARGEVKPAYYFIDLAMIKSLLISWGKAIQRFAEEHKDKRFYVFGIQGFSLVANSEESFNRTLEDYRKKFPNKYVAESTVEKLRFSPGDFAFHFDDLPASQESIDLDFSFLSPRLDEQRAEPELFLDGLIHNK